MTFNDRARARRTDLENALGSLLDTTFGRHIIWEWLGEFGLFRSSFDLNPVKMGYNEGQRSAALWVLTQIEDSRPDIFARMKAENLDREHRYEAIPADQPEDGDIE